MACLRACRVQGQHFPLAPDHSAFSKAINIMLGCVLLRSGMPSRLENSALHCRPVVRYT